MPTVGVDSKGAIYASTVIPTDFFHSGDNGQTWRSMKNGLEHQGAIQALAFDGDVVYAGTSAGNLLRLRGENWELIHTLGAGNLWINAIGVESNGVVFLGTSQGLYRMDTRSGNNGNALAQIGEGASALVVTNDGEIFAGSSDGIRHSNAEGAHWAKLGPEAFVYSLIVLD